MLFIDINGKNGCIRHGSQLCKRILATVWPIELQTTVARRIEGTWSLQNELISTTDEWWHWQRYLYTGQHRCRVIVKARSDSFSDSSKHIHVQTTQLEDLYPTGSPTDELKFPTSTCLKTSAVNRPHHYTSWCVVLFPIGLWWCLDKTDCTPKETRFIYNDVSIHLMLLRLLVMVFVLASSTRCQWIQC